MVSPTTGQGECWHLSATGVLTAVPAMRHAARNPEYCPPRPGPTNRLRPQHRCDFCFSPCARRNAWSHSGRRIGDLVSCLRALSGRLTVGSRGRR